MPLGVLFKILNQTPKAARLFDAGERLRADYERAQLSPSITMRWDPVRIKGGPDAGLSPTERQMAAKERFDGALAAAVPAEPKVILVRRSLVR